MRMLTIKDVYNECEKQMLNGNGDKILLVAADEEGNNYHPMWYGIENDVFTLKTLIKYGCINKGFSADDITVIG